MIEAKPQSAVQSPATPTEDPGERDLLLHSAARKLLALSEEFVEAGNSAYETERAAFTQLAGGLLEALQAVRMAIREGGQPPVGPPVAGGGLSPDNDPMEDRVKTLETDMREARDRLVRVEVKIDGLEKKVDLLPSRDFVVSQVSKSSAKIITWVVVAVGAAQLIPSLVVPLLKYFNI